MYLLLLVAHPTYFQYLSIVTSIATAAFTIASMDFNTDTDPKLRRPKASGCGASILWDYPRQEQRTS
jgi:hypothetical protein